MKYIRIFEKFLQKKEVESRVDELFELIKKDCSKFINEVNFPIFRGIEFDENRGEYFEDEDGNEIPLYFKRKMGKDRYPRDNSTVHHNIFNDKLYKKFGKKVRNGLFTTPDMRIANSYGDGTFMFFPIGDYKYYWSPIVVDLYEHIQYSMWNVYDIPTKINNEWNSNVIIFVNGKNSGIDPTQADVTRGTQLESVIRNNLDYFYDYKLKYEKRTNNYINNKIEYLKGDIEERVLSDHYTKEEYFKIREDELRKMEEDEIDYIVNSYIETDINDSSSDRNSNEVIFFCDEFHLLNFEFHNILGLPSPGAFLKKLKDSI